MNFNESHDSWMTTSDGTFIDIHDGLRTYDEVIRFFTKVEQEFDRKKYCNGENTGGRWIYQILTLEFVKDLAALLNAIRSNDTRNGPILEVMAGDGLLSHYLQPLLTSQIISTDAKTSRDQIEFPKSMEQLDALEAIAKYEPSLVLMSWEPFYSDTSRTIIETGIPTVWIGDPRACAVSSSIHEIEHLNHASPFLLGRHDDFTTAQFRTELRVYNHP